MALLEVIKYGHPTLRSYAAPFKKEEIDPQFIQNMIETMYEKDGVGLAATQVNVRKRLVVITDFENLYIVINPEIIAYSENVIQEIEGCLSLPGLQADVPRHEKVVVKGLDVDGNPLEIKAAGLLARVFQHEIDHLNGVLYIDRADLTTLCWVKPGEGESESILEATTLDEVKREYRIKYHSEQTETVFDRIDS